MSDASNLVFSPDAGLVEDIENPENDVMNIICLGTVPGKLKIKPKWEEFVVILGFILLFFRVLGR